MTPNDLTFNEDLEISLQEVQRLLDDSSSHIVFTKDKNDNVSVAGYASSYDALIMILNFLTAHKHIGRTLLQFLRDNERKLHDSSE